MLRYAQSFNIFFIETFCVVEIHIHNIIMNTTRHTRTAGGSKVFFYLAGLMHSFLFEICLI